MRADLFLAWKYFKPKRSAVSVITLISVIGVGLGVAVLIVVLAVMTGFTDKMKEKLLETSAHGQICTLSGDPIYDPEVILKAAKKNHCDALPVLMSPVLLQKNDRFVPKQLLAFDAAPVLDWRVNLKAAVSSGRYSLERGEIMLGAYAAAELGIYPGDKILLHSPSNLAKLVRKNSAGRYELVNSAYLPGEYKVTGIVTFGKYDFDKNTVFLNLDDADRLFGLPAGSSNTVFFWTQDPYRMEKVMKKLRSDLSFFSVYSWQDLNKRLLGVLAVEKNMQFFLLVFIVLVAAFSITNTLITTVIQKTREIGLLKSLGASSGTIMRIFILQGFFVGAIGTAFGIGLGILIIRFRMAILETLRVVTGQDLFPKEFYVFNELPAHIVPSDIAITALIAIILCTLGGVIPAFRAARLDPATALRTE